MSRFERPAFQRLLDKILDPQNAGIGYVERVRVFFANPGERFAWRTRLRIWTMVGWPLIALSGFLLFTAVLQHRPRSVVPFLPLLGIALLGPGGSLLRRVRKPGLMSSRGTMDMAAFAAQIGIIHSDAIRVAEAVRTAFSRVYGIPSVLVLPQDSERTLRPFSDFSSPFAFEFVVGTKLLLDQHCELDDNAMDKLIARMHCEARTVADVVRMLCAT